MRHVRRKSPCYGKVIPMKKMIGLLLCTAILLSFAACGSSEAPAPTDAAVSATVAATEAVTPTQAPTEEPTQPAPVRAPFENVVLVDNEQVAFTVVKAEDSDHLGMQLQVQCVNKGSRTLMFSWDMVSVCGYMYDPMWAVEVAAGKAANSTIDLDTYALGKMGIDSVDEITFTLRIYDSENWMDEPIVADVFTIYPTGLSAETFTLSSHVFSDAHAVIADNEQLRFIIDGITDDGASGSTVHVYLENKTARNLLYAWDLVSVNGKMVDPFWGTTVGAGKRACTGITFSRSDLEQNGITGISDIEFTLTVSDYDSWETPNLLEGTYTYTPDS